MKALNGPAINMHQEKNSSKWNEQIPTMLFYLMMDNCFFMTFIALPHSSLRHLFLRA